MTRFPKFDICDAIIASIEGNEEFNSKALTIEWLGWQIQICVGRK